MAVAVADLVQRTAERAGFALLDVGLYLDGPDGVTKAIREGLYGGATTVGLSPSDPFELDDADLASIGGGSARRCVDVAELHCLKLVLGRWHLAHRANGEKQIVEGDPIRRGILWEEKQALMRRIADLEAEVASPIPGADSGIVSVVNREPIPTCCRNWE